MTPEHDRARQCTDGEQHAAQTAEGRRVLRDAAFDRLRTGLATSRQRAAERAGRDDDGEGVLRGH